MMGLFRRWSRMAMCALGGAMGLAAEASPPADGLWLRSAEGHGGPSAWRMQQRAKAGGGGDLVSQPGFDVSGWQGAVVPGTVLNSLVHNGVFPEPYVGLNNAARAWRIPEISEWGREFYTCWFRTEFELTPAFRGRRVMLQLDGVNYRAEIWLNGRRVGDLAGMFQRGVYDITGMVHPTGRNALAVLVEPPDVVGRTVAKKGREGAFGENTNGGDRTIGRNVTMLMSVGWDFTAPDGIRDRNTGIWKDVCVYPVGPVALRHPYAGAKLPLPDLAPASLTVSADAVNLTRETQRGVLRARIPEAGVAVEQAVELAAGETREVTFDPGRFPALALKEPKLWWPLNKGPQNLYTLELELGIGNDVSDRNRTRFGIREITSDRQTPDRSRLFHVNGRRLFIRGSNWIPEAMCRGSDARTYAELRWTAQAGVNMLRQWGGGITESDRFYELCDELGILVWTEFWQTGNTDLPADPALYRANVADTIRRIRTHPSQAYYVSANERDAKGIVPIEDLVARLHPGCGYQPGSETDGIHDGSPYGSINPMWYYENTGSDRGSRIDGFNPEYGCPCLPTLDAIREMMDERDFWPVNKEVWDYLDGGGFHRMSTDYVRGMQQYGPARNAGEFAMRGQAYGALAHRAVWECWSRNKLDYGDRFASGLLFWYHNSPVRQVCGRMWDWSLEPTAALYFTAKANEPLHPQFDFLKDTVSVVNEFPRPFRGGAVRLRVLNPDMKEVLRQEANVDVAADAVTNDVIRVQWPEGLAPVHFLKLELRDAEGRTVGDNFYWRSTKPYRPKRTWTGPQFEGFESLAGLPAVALESRVSEGRRDGWSTRTVTVRNPSSDRLAFLVWLRLQHADTGKPVRPAFATDNFFSLLPGESKTVTFEFDEKAAGAGKTRLVVDGWNVRRQIWAGGALQPVAIVEGPAEGRVPDGQDAVALSFDGSASGAPGLTLKYAWSVDGKPAATEAKPSLKLGPGRHAVTLTVATPDGRTAKADHFVTVAGPRIVKEALSSSNETPARTPDKAIDRDPETRWASARKDAEWLALDLGQRRKIAGAQIDWEAAYATVYKFQVSDDRESWKDVLWVRDGQGGREIRRFAPVEARYLRMVGVKRATQYGFSLYEMSVILDGWASADAPATGKPAAPAGWPDMAAKNRGLDAPQDAATLPKSRAPEVTRLEGGRLLPRPGGGAAAPPPGEVILAQGWKLIEAPRLKGAADGAALSKPGVDTAGWRDAVVPGTVLATLVRAGVYPDPYFGLNHLRIPDSLCRQDYWYRVEFDTPKVTAGGAVTLQFNGVNYRAEAWLNGAKLGDVIGAFTRGRFDVGGRLAAGGRNALAVRISPPPNPGIPHEQSIAAGAGPNGGRMCLDGPTFFCTEGWDWIPGVRDRCAGLWQDVALQVSGPVRIEDVHVVTDLPLPDTSRADVVVHAELRNTSSNAVAGTLIGRFEGGEFRKAVALRPGESRVAACAPPECAALAVRNPRLWWPNGLGRPDLYHLRLAFEPEGGAAGDERRLRFGIREFSYELSLHAGGGAPLRREYRPTDWWRTGGIDPIDRERVAMVKGEKDIWLHTLRAGQEASPALAAVDNLDPAPFLALRVNGVRVHCRGGNWGMDDLLKDCSRARLEPYVRLHREANVNMLRNWCGQSTSEALYDLCDEYGILVWNEFWLTTEGWNLDPKDEPLLLANARDAVMRFRHHPSIALWSGRNEGVPPEICNRGLDQLVRELDGTRHYQPNSRQVNLLPSGPWRFCPEEEYFTKHSRGFTTELGVPSVPEAETLKKFIAPADLWPPSDVWAYHDWHSQGGIGVAPFMEAITNRLGAPADLDDFDRKAQLLNYTTHRAMFEGANSGLMKPCTGLLMWMSHPSWPSTVWQMYAWNYDTHGAFYGIRKACEPRHIQYNGATRAVEVANHTAAAIRGAKAEAVICEVSGREVGRRTADAEVGPVTWAKAMDLPAPPEGQLQFLRLAWRGAGGEAISDNFYWIGAKPSDWRALAGLPAAKVEGRAAASASEGGTRVRATVRNAGPGVALLARIVVRDGRTGVRVLPAYYSDNYFSLLPGEERAIEIDCPAGAVSPGDARLTLHGWNIAETEVPVR